MNTLFIGQSSIELISIDSTNNYVLELLKEASVADGTIVWTQEQTAGRGQRGNNWISRAGENITLSLLLHPELRPQKQFYLTKVISLAVAAFVGNMLGNKEIVQIKWPNDIYVSEKKIAGILIENILRGDIVNSSIVGIGLNINQCEFDESLKNVTSLKLLTKTEFNIKKCIDKLCEQIEPRYLQLKANKLELLNIDYHKKLYRLDAVGVYKKNGELFNATLTGVTEQGKLLLRLRNTEIISCDFKEVIFV